ncbi:MAG: hypothetical protein MI748_02965 [Opitutales bacterium]|nr:hypothetical protein [Opitutales bacterium]
MNDTYQQLLDDEYFTSEIGKLILTAGRFEFVFKRYLHQNEHLDDTSKRVVLRRLIEKLKEKEFLNAILEYHLNVANEERNYFVHRVAEQLADFEIDEKEKERFRRRVRRLKEEFEFFSKIFEEE